MFSFVTITNAGQITIPAKMRAVLGIKKSEKAIVSIDGEIIKIKKMPDIIELAGVFRYKAIKNKSIEEIMKLEEEAIGQAIVEDYKKSL